MKVVNVIGLGPTGDYKIELSDVPDTWEKCSVTGEYRPIEEFGKGFNSPRRRTSCDRAYNMTLTDMVLTNNRFDEIKQGDTYKSLWYKLLKNADFLENTIKIKDMIEALQKLDPEDLLCITQEGYYANGNRAELFFPELLGSQQPEFGTKKVYVIGSSSQNC